MQIHTVGQGHYITSTKTLHQNVFLHIAQHNERHVLPKHPPHNDFQKERNLGSCQKQSTMHMHHQLPILPQGVANEPRVTQERSLREREIIVNDGIRMFPQSPFPFSVFAHQGRKTMPAPFFLVSLTQLKVKILLLGIISDNKTCDRGNATDILPRVKRRRSYDYIQLRNDTHTIFGAVRQSYEVTFTYEGSGKNEIATSMTWTRKDDRNDMVRKFHGKYVLLTSLDEKQELNIWKFYNVIRTVEETFHVLKTDLDIRPVYHKSDDGIKAHLNLAILAYWIVSVTKFRLKVKNYDNVRWDEIMRIASTQVVVTAKVETADGQTICIRQSTQSEDKLSAIYSLLDINSKPLGKRKSMLHPNRTSKNPNSENQEVT